MIWSLFAGSLVVLVTALLWSDLRRALAVFAEACKISWREW